MTETFKKGDIVKLKNGNSPQKVYDVRFGVDGRMLLMTIYLSSERYYESNHQSASSKWRHADRFEHYHHQPKAEELFPPQYQKETTMTQNPDLYQLKDAPARFGTVMTTSSGTPVRNSQGHLILEMKGEGGKVEAFPEDKLELVTPYTIQLTRLSTSGEKENNAAINVIGEPGQVQKDDVLLELNSGTLWRVTELDSKCRSARENKSKWIKIATEMVKFGV